MQKEKGKGTYYANDMRCNAIVPVTKILLCTFGWGYTRYSGGAVQMNNGRQVFSPLFIGIRHLNFAQDGCLL
jgi:hypothetical protein